MRRIAALLPRQRGATRRADGEAAPGLTPHADRGSPNGAPCDNRPHGNRRGQSASRSGPASATACARRSTRPRRRRPPARRRIPSARSSTTRASIRDLQALGIETVETLDDVDHGAAVVIRAHGVRPDVMERAERARPRGHRRHLHLGDPGAAASCAKLVEEGYTIVLLGTPKHPEVVGLLGFAPDAIVVDEEEEWEAAIPRKKRMALISPVDPAALEVREAGRVHGRSRPTSSRSSTPSARSRSAARRTRWRSAARGRPDGRRRRPLEREHQGADPAVRDRRHARDPDRERRAT